MFTKIIAWITRTEKTVESIAEGFFSTITKLTAGSPLWLTVLSPRTRDRDEIPDEKPGCRHIAQARGNEVSTEACEGYGARGQAPELIAYLKAAAALHANEALTAHAKAVAASDEGQRATELAAKIKNFVA